MRLGRRIIAGGGSLCIYSKRWRCFNQTTRAIKGLNRDTGL